MAVLPWSLLPWGRDVSRRLMEVCEVWRVGARHGREWQGVAVKTRYGEAWLGSVWQGNAVEARRGESGTARRDMER